MLYLVDLLAVMVGCGFGYLAVPVTGYDNENMTALAIAIGALVGFCIVHAGLQPVDAGTKTLFVCYAEEPEYMKQACPELYERIGERTSTTPKESTPLAQP